MLNLKRSLAAFASAAVICSSFTGITPVSHIRTIQPAVPDVKAAEEIPTPTLPLTTTAPAPQTTAITTTHADIDYITSLEYDNSPMAVGETRAIRFIDPAKGKGEKADISEVSSNITYEYKEGEDTVYITAAAPGKAKLYIREANCAFGAYVNIEVTADAPTVTTTATVLPSTAFTTTFAHIDYVTSLEYDNSPMVVGETRAIRFIDPASGKGTDADFFKYSDNFTYNYTKGKDTVYVTATAPGELFLGIREKNCAFSSDAVIEVMEGTPVETTVTTTGIDPLPTTTVNHIHGTTPDPETTTAAATTTTVPASTAEKQIIMRGTGVDSYKETLSYPTKIIYDEGEALDLTGLKVKVSHGYSVMYSDHTGEYITNDFDKEIAVIDPTHITIKPFGGSDINYSDEAFSKLPAGTKYTIWINGTIQYKSDKSRNYYDYIYNTDISFDVYINKSGAKEKFIKIDNAEIEKMEYGSSSKGFVLSGYEPMSIDMDAAMHPEFAHPRMAVGDTISAVIYLNTETNYIITGDFYVTEAAVVYGDANGDNKVTLADALTILQFIANEEKYPMDEKQQKAADCFNTGDGITAMDAMAVQSLDTGYITSLPVKELKPDCAEPNATIPE